MQTLFLHVRRCQPPPHCAPGMGDRPPLRFLGLQGQSFHTPPPLRVNGVWNQEDGVGAEDEKRAVGRWQGRERVGTRDQSDGDVECFWILELGAQCRRRETKKRERGLGFLKGRRKEETGSDPGELWQETKSAYEWEHRARINAFRNAECGCTKGSAMKSRIVPCREKSHNRYRGTAFAPRTGASSRSTRS